jgi:signal transduction histidine kinase
MFRAKDESEFISMGPADLSPARQPDGRASAEKAREMIETAMRNGSHFFSWTHRRIDGEEFFANVRLTRMEQDGKVMLQAIVRDITERVQRDAEARHYQQRLRELTERLAATEEEDRWRISRYIHDTIIQNLSLSSIRLGAVAKPLADAELKEEADKLHQVRSLIDQSIDECRMVMSDLTPTLLYELGLVPALNDFAQQVAAKHGTRVSVEDDGQEKPIAPPLRGLLFESTRELVVNALKHAGPCEIRVSVSCRGGALVVRVADNGQGFNTGKAMTPNHHGGFGLFSIRQRLEGLGGRLELESAPGRGTTATIIVPMGEEPGG